MPSAYWSGKERAMMVLPYEDDPRWNVDTAYTISEEAAVAEVATVLEQPSSEAGTASSPEPSLEPLFHDLIREWEETVDAMIAEVGQPAGGVTLPLRVENSEWPECARIHPGDTPRASSCPSSDGSDSCEEDIAQSGPFRDDLPSGDVEKETLKSSHSSGYDAPSGQRRRKTKEKKRVGSQVKRMR